MKPKVFITGGSGLLALNWAASARNQYAVTLGIHEREISLRHVQSKILDIESVEQIERLIDDFQPQFFVHTAGLTSVEKCESAPDIAKHINVKLAANVARACAKHKVPLVHISSDHLFQGDESFVDEEAQVSPMNVYGRTKADAEKQVLDIHPQALVIRTNFYAWGTSYRKSFSDMIINALRAERELTLFQDVYYTPLLVEELVLTLHELVTAKAEGIFNVVGDDRVSKYEFGMKLAKEFALDTSLIKRGNIVDNKSLVNRPHDMSLSNKKTSLFLNKKIGGLDKHLVKLKQQEINGLAQELQKL